MHNFARITSTHSQRTELQNHFVVSSSHKSISAAYTFAGGRARVGEHYSISQNNDAGSIIQADDNRSSLAVYSYEWVSIDHRSTNTKQCRL